MALNQSLLKSVGTNSLVTPHLISVAVERELGRYIHTQDFFEIMYVIEGEGEHWINGEVYPLQTGSLVFITPRDSHDIGVSRGKKLYFYNIGFSAKLWRLFCESVELDPYAPGNRQDYSGSSVLVQISDREECTAVFRKNLALLQTAPTKLKLYSFWTSVLPYFMQSGTTEFQPAHYPFWLANALRDMQDWQNIALGLHRFIELSGVSVSHLTRVLKKNTGLTPSEYMNDVRLKRAAILLTTTSENITDIAFDCGFESLSYFHRLFLKKYEKTPRAYRMDMRKNL